MKKYILIVRNKHWLINVIYGWCWT